MCPLPSQPLAGPAGCINVQMKELLFICERASKPASEQASKRAQCYLLSVPSTCPAPRTPAPPWGGQVGSGEAPAASSRYEGAAPNPPPDAPHRECWLVLDTLPRRSPLTPILSPLSQLPTSPLLGAHSKEEGEFFHCPCLTGREKWRWLVLGGGWSTQALAPALGAPLRWPHSSPLPDRSSPSLLPFSPSLPHPPPKAGDLGDRCPRRRRRIPPRKGKRAAPFWGPERFNNF